MKKFIKAAIPVAVSITAASFALASPAPSATGAPTTKRLSPDEVNGALQPLVELTPQGERVLVVKGRVRWNSTYLQAEVIRFEPNSELLITKTAQGLRPQSFLVADRIEVVDQNSPGTITYERDDVAAHAPSAGEAPAGTSASASGQAGGVGAPGAQGISGSTGKQAPSLTLVVMKVPSAAPVIDLRGGDGGAGSLGMKGGRGGNGAPGVPASQTLFSGCRRGAGDGGAAGSGGKGGPGGVGGAGGRGGTVTIISKPEFISPITQKFRILVAGGHGGLGGGRGAGGDSGLPGPGGQEALPFCQGNGAAGVTGLTGAEGDLGAAGKAGPEGDYTVGAITFEQYERYLWSERKESNGIVAWMSRMWKKALF